MPASYSFLPEYGCLYLKLEDPFRFGRADDLVNAFTSDQEFPKTSTLIFDLSHLTSIKIDVTRSSEKAKQVGMNFPAEGGQIAVLAPSEPGLSMAELLKGIWAPFPHVTFRVFTSETELLENLGIPREYWGKQTGDLSNTAH